MKQVGQSRRRGRGGAEGMRASDRRVGKKRSRGKRRARRDDGVCLKDVTRAKRTARAPLEAGSEALVKGLS